MIFKAVTVGPQLLRSGLCGWEFEHASMPELKHTNTTPKHMPYMQLGVTTPTPNLHHVGIHDLTVLSAGWWRRMILGLIV